jgi:HKD family nuclease/predicted house-cleaning noncanonical NTP pyrophosphatase (MazG superfamily)
MMDHPLTYNKQPRDFVPQKIAQSGKFLSTSLLNDPAFADALRIKLIEEAHELFHADTREAIINESADLLELIDAIIEMHGISWDEVVSRQAIMRQEVGAFNKRQMLHSTASDVSGIESSDRQMHLPQLLTFNTVVGLVDIIKRELLDASSLHIASAFYSRGILNLLLDAFRDFVRRGGTLRLLTSVMGNFNNPLDFQHLSTQIPEIEIRVFYPLNSYGMADFSHDPPPFHIKSYLFEKSTGQHSIIVGSSNLTGSGFFKNHEWNYFSNSETNLIFSSNSNQSAFQYALKEFENYWRDSSVPVDERFKNAYLPRWEKAHELRVDVAKKMDKAFKKAIEPRPAQIAALKSLAERRNKGVTKTTIIAATGLGKTFIAAFDFMQSAMKNVLFIAHRENILNKSLEVFQTVDINFSGEILSGLSKPAHKNGGSLFAMVQTISQPAVLEEYAVDDFDYIVSERKPHICELLYLATQGMTVYFAKRESNYIKKTIFRI